MVTGCRLGKRALKFRDFGKVAATFCDLPYGFPIEVSLPAPTGLRAHVMMVEVERTGITGRVVYGRINR